MKKLIKGILVIIIFLYSAAVIMASSLMDKYNLSFEMDSIGSNKVPKQWTFQTSPTVSYSILGKPPQAAGGSKCLMVDYSKAIAGDESRMFMSDFIKIDPTQKYLLSFWLKTEGKTNKGFGVSVGTLYFDKNKKSIVPEIYADRYQVSHSGNLEWTRYLNELLPMPDMKSNSFKANQIPPNAKYVRLFFLSYCYNKKYWIDDLRLEPSRATAGTFVQGNTKIAHAVVSKDKISIDGRLSEAIWNNSNDWNSGFTRTVCKESESCLVINQTRFKIVQDNRNIYLGAECNLSNIKSIKSKVREYNSMSVFEDEDIEIFLDCSGRRKEPFHIAINASGSFTELYFGIKRNLGLEVATTRTSSGWTAEVRIPKDKLWQFYIEAGSRIDKYLWNINICRHHPGGPVKQRFSAWNYTGGAFYNKGALGVLLFEKNKTVLSNRVKEACLQVQTILQDNKSLLKDSLVAAIRNEQTVIFEMESFLKEFKKSLSSVTVLPDYIFSRYLSEIDIVPERINKSFQALRRFSLAFPEERKKYGYMIYEVPLASPNKSDMYPTKGECKQLVMRIAGDEISSKRFSLLTRKELKDVKLKCSVLKSKDGMVIPGNKVDLRILKPWGSAYQADILVTDERVKLKGYLEKYSEHPRLATNIPANSTKHFLLQIEVSSDLKPGTYKGSIHIEPAGSLPTSLPVSVEILPFKLNRTERFVGFFFTGVLFQPKGPAIGSVGQTFYNGLASENSLKKEFETLAASGFNFLSVGGYAGGPLNIDYVSKILEIASKAGIKKIALQGTEHFITPNEMEKYLNKDSKTYQILENRILKIAEIAKKSGIELYIYGLDEPHDKTGILRNNLIFKIAKHCGVNTMTAIIRDDIREQVNELDVVAMNFSAMSAGGNRLLGMVSRREQTPYKKITYYANMQAAQTPAVRMAFGWYLFKSHMGGNVPWAYYALWQNWRPFYDSKADSENCAYYVFPTKDRPIPTLKFEVAREGVNDLRYLEMLEKELACSKNTQKTEKYKKELDKMLSVFSLVNDKDNISENYLISPQVYEDFRNKVQDMLIDLLKNNNTK